MKKKLPIILIVVSIALVATNIITTDDFDNAFWMQTLSSMLLVIAMLFTIRSRNKADNK